MSLRVSTLSRLLLLPALLAGFAACETDENRIPSNNPATPVLPVSIVVELSTDKSTLNSQAENPRAKLHVVAYRTDTWEPLPDGTEVVLTTNMGSFDSVSGPSELTVEMLGGVVDTFFYPGFEPGIARIRAEVREAFDIEQIEIR